MKTYWNSNTKLVVNKLNRFAFSSFIRHWTQAQGKYFLHSPFVYDWYSKVLRGDRSASGKEIETLRKKLRKRGDILQFADLGAGSRKGVTQKLGKMVNRAGRRRASGELLRRLVHHHQYRRGLELGTHIGLSTLYVNHGYPFETFITIEGIEALAQVAQYNFESFGISPKSLVGPFDEVLEKQLDLSQLKPDYVFIDGNHKYEPTIRYFHQILPYVGEGGAMVFDDIYWSSEMQQAWKEICNCQEVSVSIDLYFLGICYIRRNQAKEHFRFRFWER